MNPGKPTRLAVPRRQKLFASFFTAVLLSAVPAFGLIYTGNWIVMRNTQTGGAPKAIIDKSDPASLVVDMGTNSRKFSTSTVVVRRSFRVENLPWGSGNNSRRGETVSLLNQFSTLMRDGLAIVIARIIPNHGSLGFFDPYVKNVGHHSTTTLSRNYQRSVFLRPGSYTLEITIVYINRRGFWDNHNSGSPHRFTLSSI
jgi:hypothetical protein